MIENITRVGSLSSTRSLADITESSSTMRGAMPSGETAGVSFASVLGNMTTDTMNSLKAAEMKSFEGIQGKADTREVVDAVLQAQQSLNTAIALRDKVVNAYLEISKMSI
ncbi:flagellar hook-basal body complex protein FliE [Neorhizobium sp. T786]|uniref:flagellar hook-basal body complex protein FliE n=1 Tax=Pseudorhizobium xiangyangii TaxID=2883104 RepID=UPI001CFF800D|nr:flagellar hook-basal body complex protein FliE [Neorhizobium xiangyangii]MCB5202647.1 flagellar hook-basal body complex protein FliE [Neorhizobium xiangyangii]